MDICNSNTSSPGHIDRFHSVERAIQKQLNTEKKRNSFHTESFFNATVMHCIHSLGTEVFPRLLSFRGISNGPGYLWGMFGHVFFLPIDHARASFPSYCQKLCAKAEEGSQPPSLSCTKLLDCMSPASVFLCVVVCPGYSTFTISFGRISLANPDVLRHRGFFFTPVLSVFMASGNACCCEFKNANKTIYAPVHTDSICVLTRTTCCNLMLTQILKRPKRENIYIKRGFFFFLHNALKN